MKGSCRRKPRSGLSRTLSQRVHHGSHKRCFSLLDHRRAVIDAPLLQAMHRPSGGLLHNASSGAQVDAGAEVIVTQPPLVWGKFESWFDQLHR